MNKHCLSSFALITSSIATTAVAAVTMDAPGHVAVEGSPVVAHGGEPGTSWTLLDWRGRPTGTSGVFDKDGSAKLPPLPTGYYRMVDGTFDAEGSTPDATNAMREAMATLAVVPPPESRVMNHDAFYAIDSAQSWVSRPGNFECPWNGGDTFRTVSDLIRLAGFPHVRERLSWREVNPKPGVMNCAHYMYNAHLLQKRGILISGMFHDAPEWAGRKNKLPLDLNAVYDFCSMMATVFGDRMGDWEFWNEEDIHFCPEPVWDYAAALKAAYLGFKSGRPGKTVLPGALLMGPDHPYARTLFDNDAAKYGDVFNYHIYLPIVSYPRTFAGLRGFMERYGIGDRAIWITESGTRQEGNSTKESVKKGQKAHSPEQELVVAEFYAKSQIAMQMEGIARNYYFVFGAYNEDGGAKDWGAMRRDGTMKPGYAAMSTMIREVGQARLDGELRVGKGLRAYIFTQPDGSQTLAFWSVSPVDTAGGGVKSEPDFTRELRLAKDRLRAQAPMWVSDLCGVVTNVTPEADGAIVLAATRYPAYLSGLHGLVADVPARPAGKVMPYVPAADEDLSVIIRVDLNSTDFKVSGQKNTALLKGDKGRLHVQVWNLGDTSKTGSVEVAGASLEGLPETISLGPRGTPPAEFDCVLTPGADSPNGTLVLTGVFGGRRSSRLSMPFGPEKKDAKP